MRLDLYNMAKLIMRVVCLMYFKNLLYFLEEGHVYIKASMHCWYGIGGLFHVEMEMGVCSNEHLEGQYFMTTGTQGEFSDINLSMSREGLQC